MEKLYIFIFIGICINFFRRIHRKNSKWIYSQLENLTLQMGIEAKFSVHPSLFVNPEDVLVVKWVCVHACVQLKFNTSKW